MRFMKEYGMGTPDVLETNENSDLKSMSKKDKEIFFQSELGKHHATNSGHPVYQKNSYTLCVLCAKNTHIL